MSKMWGSLIASPRSTTSKFPSCRAQALLSRLIVEISRAEGRYFWFRGFFFFWGHASVKKAKLHRGVISYARLLWPASWQFGGLGRVRACVLLDFDFARPFTEVKKDCLWLEKNFVHGGNRGRLQTLAWKKRVYACHNEKKVPHERQARHTISAT